MRSATTSKKAHASARFLHIPTVVALLFFHTGCGRGVEGGSAVDAESDVRADAAGDVDSPARRDDDAQTATDSASDDSHNDQVGDQTSSCTASSAVDGDPCEYGSEAASCALQGSCEQGVCSLAGAALPGVLSWPGGAGVMVVRNSTTCFAGQDSVGCVDSIDSALVWKRDRADIVPTALDVGCPSDGVGLPTATTVPTDQVDFLCSGIGSTEANGLVELCSTSRSTVWPTYTCWSAPAVVLVHAGAAIDTQVTTHAGASWPDLDIDQFGEALSLEVLNAGLAVVPGKYCALLAGTLELPGSVDFVLRCWSSSSHDVVSSYAFVLDPIPDYDISWPQDVRVVADDDGAPVVVALQLAYNLSMSPTVQDQVSWALYLDYWRVVNDEYVHIRSKVADEVSGKIFRAGSEYKPALVTIAGVRGTSAAADVWLSMPRFFKYLSEGASDYARDTLAHAQLTFAGEKLVLSQNLASDGSAGEDPIGGVRPASVVYGGVTTLVASKRAKSPFGLDLRLLDSLGRPEITRSLDVSHETAWDGGLPAAAKHRTGWLVRRRADKPEAGASVLNVWLQATCQESGVCAALTYEDCDDDDPCTKNLCEPDVGCVNPLWEDGVTCGEGKTCQAGLCVEG